MKTDAQRKYDMDQMSPFQDAPCVCFADGWPCICPRSERALRNISNHCWPHGEMTAAQREWCIEEILNSREGGKREDVHELTDRDLAHDVIIAWQQYCRDKGML